MIESVYIKNFKSIKAQEINLLEFNCLLGMNGSGKTNLIQFFDFLSYLFNGKSKDWFATRNIHDPYKIKFLDITKAQKPLNTSKFEDIKSISFQDFIDFGITFRCNDDTLLRYEGRYNILDDSIHQENVWILDKFKQISDDDSKESYIDRRLIFKARIHEYGDFVTFHSNDFRSAPITFTGSIFNKLKKDQYSPLIKEMVDYIKGIRTFDMYNQDEFLNHMYSKEYTGKNLLLKEVFKFFDEYRSHYINKDGFKKYFDCEMQKFYPNFAGLISAKLDKEQSGCMLYHKQLIKNVIDLTAFDVSYLTQTEFNILSYLIALNSHNTSMVLIDNPFNGIEYTRYHDLFNLFLNSSRQVVVSFHDVNLLNVLGKEKADSVIYTYRDETKAYRGSLYNRSFMNNKLQNKLKEMDFSAVYILSDLADLLLKDE